jgi:cytochrome c oxidase subunit 1
MLTFMLGGITGLINASYTINRVVHNTTFIPGHFHLTVGSAVALSFMGIAYWLVPYLTDKKLWGRRLAVLQTWLYGIGVLIMARGLISGGLEGMPRRTFVALSPYNNGQWHLAGVLTAIGGSMMFASVVLFFLVLAGTLVLGERGVRSEIPFTETLTAPATGGWEARLDRFRYWVAITVVLILIAYGPFLATYLPGRFLSPGFKIF